MEVNETLQDAPEKVNSDPFGEAWMIKIKIANKGEVDGLMTSAEYEDYTKSEE